MSVLLSHGWSAGRMNTGITKPRKERRIRWQTRLKPPHSVNTVFLLSWNDNGKIRKKASPPLHVFPCCLCSVIMGVSICRRESRPWFLTVCQSCVGLVGQRYTGCYCCPMHLINTMDHLFLPVCWSGLMSCKDVHRVHANIHTYRPF